MSDWKTQLKRSDGRFALIRTKDSSTPVFKVSDDNLVINENNGTISFISASNDREDLEYYIQFRTELGLGDNVRLDVVDTQDSDLDEILNPSG